MKEPKAIGGLIVGTFIFIGYVLAIFSVSFYVVVCSLSGIW